RPVRPPRLPPTPWPVGVPMTVPARPTAPAILTTAHVPPEPILPPRQHKKRVLPYSSAQRVAGYLALCLLTFLIPCGLLGPVLGRAVNAQLSVRLLVGIQVLFLLVAGGYWLVLEWKRRREQAEANQDYEEEQRERRRLARAQLEAWERKLNAAVTAAENQYRP